MAEAKKPVCEFRWGAARGDVQLFIDGENILPKLAIRRVDFTMTSRGSEVRLEAEHIPGHGRLAPEKVVEALRAEADRIERLITETAVVG